MTRIPARAAIVYSQCPAPHDLAPRFPQFAEISARFRPPQPVPAAMIQHVTRQIPPSELDRCVEFYAILGFESVAVPPGIAGRALWLERRHTQIHLMPVDSARPAPGHVGLIVESYADTLARLREAGHEADPRREHWGSPRCYVYDPAGNLVELMASGPGDPEPAPAGDGEAS